MIEFQLSDRYSVGFNRDDSFLIDKETGKKALISRDLGNLLIDTTEMAQELTGLGCQVVIGLDLSEMGKCQIEFSNG